MTYQQHIEHLRQLTTKKDQDFAQLMEYFMSNLADNPIFFNAQIPINDNNKFYHALLEPVANFCGQDVEIKFIYLFQMQDTPFIHGTALLSNNKLVLFYFFDDIKTGMAVLPFLQGRSHYFRLSLFISTMPPVINNTMH